MTPTPAIGDFSKATHLSVKTLGHYHEIGWLEPVARGGGLNFILVNHWPAQPFG